MNRFFKKEISGSYMSANHSHHDEKILFPLKLYNFAFSNKNKLTYCFLSLSFPTTDNPNKDFLFDIASRIKNE